MEKKTDARHLEFVRSLMNGDSNKIEFIGNDKAQIQTDSEEEAIRLALHSSMEIKREGDSFSVPIDPTQEK